MFAYIAAPWIRHESWVLVATSLHLHRQCHTLESAAGTSLPKTVPIWVTKIVIINARVETWHVVYGHSNIESPGQKNLTMAT